MNIFSPPKGRELEGIREELNSIELRRTYGWRALIGLIVPSVNINCEPEFYRMAPKGVSVHTARAISEGPVSRDHYATMAAATADAARLLATAEPDLIVYACTSGSLLCDRESIKKGMSNVSGVPVTTTIDAVLESLATLGAHTVALGTPYLDFVTAEERVFLEEAGFRVASSFGMGLGNTYREKMAMHRVTPEAIYRLARAVDRPEADVVFISCTGLGALDVIERLEAELAKPVITSNQATFWHCLRKLGIDDRLEGFGTLLSSH